MRWNLFFFILITSLLNSFSWAQLTPPRDYPENIRLSYSYGLIYNSAVPMTWLDQFAAEVIRRTKPANEQQALLAQIDQMPASEVQKIATQIFPIDYVEVAEADLQKRGLLEILNNSQTAEEAALSPLRFTRRGQSYIRWFIHPFRDNVDTLLKALGTTNIKRGRFWAQFTESRSTIVFDTQSKGIWSIKLGIPKGTVIKYDKPVSTAFAAVHIQHSEIIAELEKMGKADPQTYQREVQAVGIRIGSHDEAEMVRSLSDIPKDTVFVSGSAVMTKGLHYFIQLDITKNFDSVYKKTEELGLKAGQVAAATGLVHNSNHTQNYGFLINTITGVVTPVFRDPDFEFDLANQATQKYIRRIRKWEWTVARTVDFRTNDTLGFKGIGYSEDEHRRLKYAYLQAFQKAFLERSGYKGPAIPIDPNRPYLRTIDLNALVVGTTPEGLEKKAAQLRDQLQYPFVAEVTQKYSKMIRAEGAHGITEIILSEELSQKHLETLGAVLKTLMRQNPKIWESFLIQSVNQFEKKTVVGSAAAEIGLKNFSRLAAELFEPEHTQLLQRFFLRLISIEKHAYIITFFNHLNGRTEKLNRGNIDVDLYGDAFNEFIEEIFKYATSKQRRFFSVHMPFYSDYLLTLPTPIPVPPPSLPTHTRPEVSVQSCLQHFQ